MTLKIFFYFLLQYSKFLSCNISELKNNKIKILHEPRREGQFGSPDYKVTNNSGIIGYIENKKIDENLNKIIQSQQIKKL